MTPSILLVAIAWTRASNFLAAVGARITAVYRDAVDTLAGAWRGREVETYVGRHRADVMSTSETNTLAAEEAEQEVRRIRAVKEATQEMLLPDFPSTVTYGRGSSHYRGLRTATLDREAKRLGNQPIVDLDVLRVRGAAPAFGDVDDKPYAEATS